MKERKVSLLPIGLVITSVLGALSGAIYATGICNKLSIVLLVIALAIGLESILIYFLVDKKQKDDAYCYDD